MTYFYLDDMLEMATEAQRFVSEQSRSDFESNRLYQLAIVHLLQIIGEAAWKVSRKFKDEHLEVAWHDIAAFRHRAVHDYFDIRLDIVWEIATTEIQPLIKNRRAIIPSGDPPDAAF